MLKIQVIVIMVLAITACGGSKPATNQIGSADSRLQFASMFCGGSGFPEDPYLICTPAQLISTDSENNPGMKGLSFQLANDLDFTGFQPPFHSQGIESATVSVYGGAIENFAGILDGAGHVIKNYGVPTAANQALIGEIDGSVRNLAFTNFNVSVTTHIATGAFSSATGALGTVRVDHLTVSDGTLTVVLTCGQSGNPTLTNSSGTSFALLCMEVEVGTITGTNSAQITNAQVSNVTINVSGYGEGSVGVIAGWNSSPFNPAVISNSQVNHASIAIVAPGANWIVGGIVGTNDVYFDGAQVEGSSMTDVTLPPISALNGGPAGEGPGGEGSIAGASN